MRYIFRYWHSSVYKIKAITVTGRGGRVQFSTLPNFTNRKVAGSIPDEVNDFYQVTQSSRSNRNEYQKHKNNVSGE
jgi:hypothetical protein